MLWRLSGRSRNLLLLLPKKKVNNSRYSLPPQVSAGQQLKFISSFVQTSTRAVVMKWRLVVIPQKKKSSNQKRACVRGYKAPRPSCWWLTPAAVFLFHHHHHQLHGSSLHHCYRCHRCCSDKAGSSLQTSSFWPFDFKREEKTAHPNYILF